MSSAQPVPPESGQRPRGKSVIRRSETNLLRSESETGFMEERSWSPEPPEEERDALVHRFHRDRGNQNPCKDSSLQLQQVLLKSGTQCQDAQLSL